MGATANYGVPYPASTDHVRIWEHLQSLAQKVDDLMVQVNACGYVGGYLDTWTGSTSSSTFVDMTGTASLSFVKRSASSALLVALSVGYSSPPGTEGICGVLIDTDYEVFRGGEIATHNSYSGMRRITGIAAGTYTCKVRIRRSYGSSSIAWDQNDSYSLVIREVG
jgi:hypothetical protein